MSYKSDKVEEGEYAAPSEPLSYEPFRLGFRNAKWKDTRGLYKHQPVPDFGTARHRDQEVYWSREVMQQEWERLWSRVWLMVGHLSDVPSPGSFMKCDIGQESFVIVRGEGQELHAFYNVCQHRGTQLVTHDFGKAAKFICPFHRWEYSNTGNLLKIQDRETFRAKALCHDLNIPKLKAACWRGWIFVNMDPESQPLEAYIGAEFMDLMRAYDFETSIRIRDIVQEWPVNWKTAHEGFNEGYHVQATHPQLATANDAYHVEHDLFPNGHARSIYQFMTPAPYVAARVNERGLAEEHKIFLREAGIAEKDFPKKIEDVPHAIIAAKLKKKDGIDYSKFAEGQLIDDWGCGFFPSTETFLHPEGFFVQHWLPHRSDPEKCIYHAQVYAVPGVGELPSFMGVADADLSGKTVLPRTYLKDDQIEETGPVISQDRMLLPRLQRGMHSRGFKGGVFSDQEIRIRQFYDEYHRYLRGHTE